MNWKFWTWPWQIRELRAENRRLKAALTNEQAIHVALQLKHTALKDQTARLSEAARHQRHRGFV